MRALAHLNRLDILAALFDEVLVPPAVAYELRHPKPGVVTVEPASVAKMRITAPPAPESVKKLLAELHPGEAEAIAVALELGISVILIDERDAEAVARRMGLQPIGALGLLIRAKAQGLVPAIAPLVDRLRRELNFFMSDQLRAMVLRLANESVIRSLSRGLSYKARTLRHAFR